MRRRLLWVFPPKIDDLNIEIEPTPRSLDTEESDDGPPSYDKTEGKFIYYIL